MASDAVGSEIISAVVGYKLTGGDFSSTTPNLPQRIAILGEANNANQSGLTQGKNITSAQQAGEVYGFGSPIYQAMRILRPPSGGGVGGIPTVVYHEIEDVAGTALTTTINVAGTATTSGVHTILVNGRASLDGAPYSFAVNTGDTHLVVAARINSVMADVLGNPFTTSQPAADDVLFTTKWVGSSASDSNVAMSEGNESLGLTYAISVGMGSGSGISDTTAALAAMPDDEWSTIVVNCHDITDALVCAALNTKNGRPDATTPTGRYASTLMKPFIALTGGIDGSGNTVDTDLYPNDVTISLCPAPLSKGMPLEAAANAAALFARSAQDTPHIDIYTQSYPDMPIPENGNIGSSAGHVFRDAAIKLGASTVTLRNGAYTLVDFVTTYHPAGVIIPQHRYCRNLMLDFNVYFGYFLLEQENVVAHVIANNDDDVSASNVIKPKQWIAIVSNYAEDLAARALVSDPEFTKTSLLVNISGTNPDRLETFFKYKRTGIARIVSTTAEAGFNFGS